MTGVVTDLTVAGKLAFRALGRRMRSEIDPPPDVQAFHRDMEAVVSAAPETVVPAVNRLLVDSLSSVISTLLPSVVTE